MSTKIRILRNTVCDRKPVNKGDVITNASDRDARTLVQLKKAEYVNKKDAEKASGGMSTKNAGDLVEGGQK